MAVRTLLVRGMLSGLLTGLLAFAFAWCFGEPQVDLAIAFEDHMHQLAGDPPDPELVSRAVQGTLGLLTGLLVYATALGGILALAFAAAQGRLGRLRPRATAALLAACGFVVLILVPQLKYPANPPAIGTPDTIGLRTALYFGMIVLSLGAALVALSLGRGLARRQDSWTASLAGAGLYVFLAAIAMLILPAIDEVPNGFPASTLWRFRETSLGINLIVWLGLGLIFGAWVEKAAQPRRVPGGPWPR